jgi:hypothetical protein
VNGVAIKYFQHILPSYVEENLLNALTSLGDMTQRIIEVCTAVNPDMIRQARESSIEGLQHCVAAEGYHFDLV